MIKVVLWPLFCKGPAEPNSKCKLVYWCLFLNPLKVDKTISITMMGNEFQGAACSSVCADC